MLKIGLFFLLAPFALIELLIYQRFDLLILGGLYFGLTLQGDWAAEKFLRLGPARKPKEEELTEFELKVHRLGERKSPSTEPLQAAAPSLQDLHGLRGLHELQDDIPTQGTPKPQPPNLPAQPKFFGQAHEILGVREDAHTRTIMNAFRHWIKRFHPDRAIGIPVEMANDRVQRLSDAKDKLLVRRKSRREA